MKEKKQISVAEYAEMNGVTVQSVYQRIKTRERVETRIGFIVGLSGCSKRLEKLQKKLDRCIDSDKIGCSYVINV